MDSLIKALKATNAMLLDFMLNPALTETEKDSIKLRVQINVLRIDIVKSEVVHA